MISKDLELGALVNVSATQARIYAAAQSAFRTKYGSSTVEINNRGMNKDEQFAKRGNFTMLTNFDFTLKALRLFGHLISKLSINYMAFDASQREQINNYVNEYCAPSLEEIELAFCEGDELSQMERAFTRVHRVRFMSGDLNTENVKLNQLFPALRSLSMGSLRASDSKWMEDSFPHLESLEISSYRSTSDVVFRLNPQLRHISMFDCDLPFLSMLNEHVPQLESINSFTMKETPDFAGAPVHFEHLKKFKLGAEYSFALNLPKMPLVFENLTEFEMYGSLDNWFDSIAPSKQLKEITFADTTQAHLNRIKTAFPEVEKITISFKDDAEPTPTVDESAVELLGPDWQFNEETGKFLFVKNGQ